MAESVLKLQTRGLRAVSIKQTIKDIRDIRPFEDITQIIEQGHFISVSKCACRHRKNLDLNETSQH